MAAITRAQFRSAIEGILLAQQTATPGLLRKVSRHHPGGMAHDKPVAWIGDIEDALEYDGGVRTRTMTTEGQIATTFSADKPSDDFDDLMDALVERFTASYNVISNTVLELTSVVPSDVAIPRADGGSDIYRGSALGIRLRIWEGRT